MSRNTEESWRDAIAVEDAVIAFYEPIYGVCSKAERRAVNAAVARKRAFEDKIRLLDEENH